MNGIYDTNLMRGNIDKINGRATFIDKNTVEVDGNLYSAKHILIATGSKPSVPAYIPGYAVYVNVCVYVYVYVYVHVYLLYI